MNKKTWFLPDYIEDQLPAEAQAVETLRRSLIDWFRQHGYLYVGTPMIEHLETLLTGVGEDLDSRTFKFTDSLSGRTLGIRADITPQTARIDAYLRKQSNLNRLCYCGPVLHAIPSHPWSNRELLQIGAELYGCSAPSADWECIDLACSSLRQAGHSELHIDLGHASIFNRMTKDADAKARQSARQALVRRDLAPIRKERGDVFPEGMIRKLEMLIETSVESEPLAALRARFAKDTFILEVADKIEALVEALAASGHESVGIDFCSLAGYGYHTGMVFDIYSVRRRLVRGGRYDGAHTLYNDNRPAVGFSMDLKEMARTSSPQPQKDRRETVAVPVPSRIDPSWSKAVAQLRKDGTALRFIHADNEDTECCSAKLVKKGKDWHVSSVS